MSVLSLPSSSFLEYAFLRWVLLPAAKPEIVSKMVAQHRVDCEDHHYFLDYSLCGSERRIAIELDGWAFHGDREAFSYDRMRQNEIHALGWTTLRFSYDSIRADTARCVAQLSAMLRSDPALRPYAVANPIIETPEMEPDAIHGLGASPLRGNFSARFESVGNYFDQVRSRLSLKTLRLCQQEAFGGLASYFAAGGKNAACIMAVGSGKTALGVATCLGFTRKRALIVTPGNVIRGNFDRAFDATAIGNALYGLPGGPLIPNLRAPRVLTLSRDNVRAGERTCEKLLDAEVIVTNFHALGDGSNLDDLLGLLQPDDIDLLIVDEAHIAAAQSYQRLFNHFEDAKTLLMSGCFQRLDGKPIEADVVYRYRLIDAIADGNAKNPRLLRFAPQSDVTTYELIQPDGTRIEIVGRDALLEVLRDERKMARVTAKSDASIRHLARAAKRALNEQSSVIAPIRPRVLFAALGETHAHQIARVAGECGIKCGVLHHSMPEGRVRQTLERFESEAGDLQGIVQLKMLGQGYDFPPICVVVPIRSYGSFGEFYQFIGRGVRVLRGVSSPADQLLDIIYHGELSVDEHIDALYRENEMDPLVLDLDFDSLDEAEGENPTGDGEAREISPAPMARVLFERGEVEERVLHDEDHLQQRHLEREKEALAQRYAVYARKTPDPVSFDQFALVMSQFRS